MPDLLAIEGLRAGYGEAVVLPGMSLRLAEGQVLALLGRNGTGKTTLINSIVGITRRFGGTIALGGRDITAMRPDQRARAGIGWVPQERNIFRSLTVEENMTAVALATKPRVLLLDEPAAGVPESERHDILAAVAALPRDVTVLLIEHDMDLVFSFADRISVLVSGALLVEGPPDEVARDPQVKAVYLGEAADA